MNDKPMENIKAFQLRKTVRKIIVYMGVFLLGVTSIHSTEEKEGIPFHVINTTWEQETKLLATVTYEENPKPVIFSLILGSVGSQIRSPAQSKSLESGKIEKFSLTLLNYYEGEEDREATMLAFLNFEPRLTLGLLKEIKFEITGRKITRQPSYSNLPPKFGEEIQ